MITQTELEIIHAQEMQREEIEAQCERISKLRWRGFSEAEIFSVLKNPNAEVKQIFPKGRW